MKNSSNRFLFLIGKPWRSMKRALTQPLGPKNSPVREEPASFLKWPAVMFGTIVLIGYLTSPKVVNAAWEAGVGFQYFSGDGGAIPSLSLSKDVGPVYVWGSYEFPEVRMLGQSLTEAHTLSLGAGQEIPIGPRWNAFWEAGWSQPFLDTHEGVQREVVYTNLVRNHNVYKRPVPVDDFRTTTTSYDLSGGPVIRLGVGYQMTEHLSLRASYKLWRPIEEYSLRDPTWQERTGRGEDHYWTETHWRNMDAMELWVLWKF